MSSPFRGPTPVVVVKEGMWRQQPGPTEVKKFCSRTRRTALHHDAAATNVAVNEANLLVVQVPQGRTHVHEQVVPHDRVGPLGRGLHVAFQVHPLHPLEDHRHNASVQLNAQAVTHGNVWVSHLHQPQQVRLKGVRTFHRPPGYPNGHEGHVQLSRHDSAAAVVGQDDARHQRNPVRVDQAVILSGPPHDLGDRSGSCKHSIEEHAHCAQE
mmetsp:Transcript_33704/g.89991  ORF Transcript_33704/g.89991 Transcript_33704/m.89991 type:complete len:211 (+) Transcript_33704:366-998(+)